MTLLLHPFVQKAVVNFKNDLPQSLLLSGQDGTGLYTLARTIAQAQPLGELFPKDAKGAIDHKSGTITIETIRSLYSQTRTKQTKRQTIIIDNADRMSHGAQNAFLKLLEEPNANIHFILTSHQSQKLLPTIRSRVQLMEVPRLLPAQTEQLLDDLSIKDATKRTQLYYLAAGLPAEIVRLVTDDAYFKERAHLIGDARTFLQATSYEKLQLIHKYRNDRESALSLLDSALTMLRRSVSSSPQSLHITQLERLLAAREQLLANGNVQLQLARIVL